MPFRDTLVRGARAISRRAYGGGPTADKGKKAVTRGAAWPNVARGPIEQRLPPIAALAILACLLWQSVEVSQNFSRILASPLWPVPALAWSALFACFGLFCASRRPGALRMRAAVRAIVPIWLTVLAAVFILGPATTLASDYWSDPLTWSYLLNLVAFPQMTLPGVFEFNNSADIVNVAVSVLPAAVLTTASAIFSRQYPRAILWTGLALLAAAALALGSGVASGEAWLMALSAVIGGQMGIRAALNGLGSVTLARFAGAVVALGVLALAGLIRPTWQPVLAAISAPLAAWFALRLLAFPLRQIRPLARFVRWPALALAYPIQQLISATPFGGGALANIALCVPAALAMGWLLDFALQKLVPLPSVALEEPAKRPEMATSRSPRHRVKILPSKELMVVALGFSLLVIGVLFLALMAMQRNPWEN